MPRALTALLLGLLLAGPASALGPGVPEPDWTLVLPSAVRPGVPFEATFRAVLPEGFYQDAGSAFLTAEPVPGQGLQVVGRRTSPPSDRGGKPSFTGSFDLTLRLMPAPGTPVPPQLSFTVGWQICRVDGVCLLPAAQVVSAPVSAGAGAADPGLGAMLAAAFVGGLLLNLMPCVFPVLALKGISLARGAGGSKRTRRREALASAAGTFSSLTAVGLVTAAAAALGQRLDWGFTFQSPGFVAALAALFWVFALQLAGFWSWPGSPFALTGSWKGGAGRAFAGGAFLVAAAVPCTAPFLGPAVGWAFGQAPAAVAGVFAAAGAGLAFPGLALALLPGSRRRLPAPGPWLKAVERAAAVLMAATAVYLVWVLAQQRGTAVWPAGLAAAGLTAGTLVLTRKARAAGGLLVAAAVLGAITAAAWPPAGGPAPPSPPPAGWEVFSEQALARARSAGKPVLVDATAAWCATCQVNEAAVLLRPDVDRLLAQKGIVRLRADYTLPDPEIARWLTGVGRAGLPVYALYLPGKPLVLFPELLTEGNFTRVLAGLP